MFSKDAARGFGEAARVSGNRKVRDALWEYNRLPSKEAKAAFVDKWTRIAVGNMESTWAMLYDSLRIIKEDKLYENAGVMEDHKPRASFKEYWEEVVGKPFQTWAELESTYHYVKEHCPDLLSTLTYGKARKLVAEKTKQGERTDIANIAKSTQLDRAQENGVSHFTQRKLDKLAAHRPDLLERVRAGELTAHGASVEAGFSKPPIIIPEDPLKASRRLLKHFTGKALTTLLTELANHAGFDLTPRG